MAISNEGGAGSDAGLRPGGCDERRRRLPEVSRVRKNDSSGSGPGDHRLDRKLNDRDRNAKGGTSRVIIQLKPGWRRRPRSTKLGGRLGRRLGLINGQVAELPNRHAPEARRPSRCRPHRLGPPHRRRDEPRGGHGRRPCRPAELGYTGAGIGVAVIDSGVTTWHDDLTYNGSSSLVKTKNGQRVAAFVDFVNGRTSPYDDNGHGTHVAGIIAGNGYDTLGVARRHRAVGAPGQPEGARPQRPRRHQRRHCGARLGGREQGALQHPRHQPVGWRAR